MSVELLDKTRKINKLLHNNNSHKVVFNDICKVLSEILLSNILVISKKGKVLGVSICPEVDEIHELIEDKVGGYIDKMLNERLLSVLSTKENVNLATLGFAEENVKKYQAIITPIDIAGERLGTLFIYKADEQYDIDDIILCEYGTTVVGLEMMRSVNGVSLCRQLPFHLPAGQRLCHRKSGNEQLYQCPGLCPGGYGHHAHRRCAEYNSRSLFYFYSGYGNSGGGNRYRYLTVRFRSLDRAIPYQPEGHPAHPCILYASLRQNHPRYHHSGAVQFHDGNHQQYCAGGM